MATVAGGFYGILIRPLRLGLSTIADTASSALRVLWQALVAGFVVVMAVVLTITAAVAFGAIYVWRIFAAVVSAIWQIVVGGFVVTSAGAVAIAGATALGAIF